MTNEEVKDAISSIKEIYELYKLDGFFMFTYVVFPDNANATDVDELESVMSENIVASDKSIFTMLDTEILMGPNDDDTPDTVVTKIRQSAVVIDNVRHSIRNFVQTYNSMHSNLFSAYKADRGDVDSDATIN